MYTDDFSHHLVATGAQFTTADALTGLAAMLGDSASLSRVYTWPTLKWDAVRAYIRSHALVETTGQLTRITRKGRAARRWLARH